MFSVLFGLSLNPVSLGSSKVLSSIIATEGGDDFFLLALLALLFWTVFQPSAGREGGDEGKGLQRSLGVVGRHGLIRWRWGGGWLLRGLCGRRGGLGP